MFAVVYGGDLGTVIEDWIELKRCLDDHVMHNQTVVSTNGVFDILHVGHVRVLQSARSLGDLLVVGINSDASVKRLKGSARPFVPQNERAEVLAALACVSYVTIFNEDTPIEMLRVLKPMIHTKGGDYQVETMPETPVMREWGGKVVSLPFVPGKSTTRLAQLIELAGKKPS